MKKFNLYMFRHLLVATVFVAVTLAVVIFLTQSLRFLELVIDSGASSGSFWILTLLALPRFLEIILPLSLLAAVIFIYNRMSADAEIIAMRSAGYSPAALARPAVYLALAVTVLLWGVTMWAAPKALSNMHQLRQIIKAQFSTFIFREGVFNQLGKGLTVYMRERTSDGELLGLLIHDSREGAGAPSTIFAKRGVLIAQEEGHQVLVYEGARQEFDPETKTLHRLNFERYTIDLPDDDPVRKRWSEPEERTIFELLNPDPDNARDLENIREFKVEIHRRIAGPLLALSFTLIGCAALLLGPVDRRGQGRRILAAVSAVIILQGLFLATFNLARQSDWGVIFMYILTLGPLFISAYMLSRLGEGTRRRLLYGKIGASS